MFRIILLAIFLMSYFSDVFSEARGNYKKSHWEFTPSSQQQQQQPPQPQQPENPITSRITYEINGRNLGDNLMSYVRGKWLAFNYKITFLYKPFPYSNQLAIHNEEKKRFNAAQMDKFEVIQVVNNELDVIFEDSSQTLYVVPCFCEPEAVDENDTNAPFFEIDWENKDFCKMLKKVMKPVKNPPSLKIPRGRTSVAVYMPQPPTSDKAEICRKHPTEYPPDSYYITQLRKLNQMLYNRPMFAYIFTENRNPLEIVSMFKTAMPNAGNIVFECRKTTRPTTTTAVDDFINLLKFDCMIRPACDLGFLAEKIHDYFITIKPMHHKMENNHVIIDEVNIKIRNP